ncbi:protein ripply2.1-like [Spea bombifrons]|uniref:protein ripply2.1-like n=1 Tax=Spea bombifrons TaxID=233779 RepID=UPI00234B94AF|nr:protein ripply2.1-like [Spea bombifrons]
MDNPRSSKSGPTKSRQGADPARCGTLWRPWDVAPKTQVQEHNPSLSLQKTCDGDQWHINHKEKLPAFQHPVKLFWPRSRCYDFLYQEAEYLLRNFPVQATISLYQETDSSSSEEEDNSDDN